MHDPGKLTKLQFFKNSLASSPIAALGLTLVRETSEKWEGDGVRYRFVFENKDRNRILEICFIPSQPPLRDVISVSIEAGKRSLYLNQYLYLIGFTKMEFPFSPQEYTGEFQHQLSSAFRTLNSALEEDTVKDILQGKTWVNLGLDWGPDK